MVLTARLCLASLGTAPGSTSASRSAGGRSSEAPVDMEEVDEGVVTGTLGGLERGSALEEVGEDGGLLVVEPVDGLGEVGLEGVGEAVGGG